MISDYHMDVIFILMHVGLKFPFIQFLIAKW